MSLPPALQQAIDTIVAALGGATIPAPVAVTSYWWDPTPEQYAAFAAKHGVPVSAVQPWTQDPHGNISGSPFPILPPVSKHEDVFEYAGYGYAPTGTQQLFTESSFTQRRNICNALKKADTPAQADFILTGAGGPGVEPDAVRLALMTGLVSLNPFITPTAAGGATVDEVIAKLTYIPSYDPNAPGPSGRR